MIMMIMMMLMIVGGKGLGLSNGRWRASERAIDRSLDRGKEGKEITQESSTEVMSSTTYL